MKNLLSLKMLHNYTYGQSYLVCHHPPKRLSATPHSIEGSIPQFSFHVDSHSLKSTGRVQ